MSAWNLQEWYHRSRRYLIRVFDNSEGDESLFFLFYWMAEIIDSHILHIAQEDLYEGAPSREGLCADILGSLMMQLQGSNEYASFAVAVLIKMNSMKHCIT